LRERWQTLDWVAIWLLLLLAALATRPPIPVDETRYLSVAWEMWHSGQFLVPHLNGEPYSHKPPLLFWLMHLGWAAFGVSDWWARSVAPLFGLGALFLARGVAGRLWPERPAAAAAVPWLLLGSALWTVFSTATMFDLLMAFFTLLGLLGVVIAWQGRPARGFSLLAAAIGLGVLAKGPVILLYTLPAAVLAPWWGGQGPAWWRWYLAVLGAVLGGALLALAWALPAAYVGGEAYRQAILWGQTAGRMVESFAHRRELWWYLPLLPVLLFPWLLWPRLWRALGRLAEGPREMGVRFALAVALPAFLAFSLISGKQVHYLLPLFPAFAWLAARALDVPDLPHGRLSNAAVALVPALLGVLLLALPWLPWRVPWEEPVPGLVGLAGLLLAALVMLRVGPSVRRMALVSPAAVLVLHLGVLPVAAPAYDTRPLALRVAAWRQAGVEVAYAGKYHGELSFVARLEAPLATIGTSERAIRAWLAEHPDGKVVTHQSGERPLPEGAEASYPYRLETFVVLGRGYLGTGRAR
jgi:hypothetical protein